MIKDHFKWTALHVKLNLSPTLRLTIPTDIAISGLTPMEGILLTLKWKKIKIYSMENAQVPQMVESATHHSTCLFFYHRSKHMTHHTSEPSPPQLRLSSQQDSFRLTTLNLSLIEVSSSNRQINSIHAVFQITILSEMHIVIDNQNSPYPQHLAKLLHVNSG